jgi:hypothetical protein
MLKCSLPWPIGPGQPRKENYNVKLKANELTGAALDWAVAKC